MPIATILFFFYDNKMDITLITIGNSHVRFCQSNGKKFSHAKKIKTHILKKPSCFGLPHHTKKILALSVVPNATKLLQQFAKKHQIDLQIFESRHYPYPNHTEKPKAVGGDRLLAALGAKKLAYQPPFIIVDVGTAITINFFDKNFGLEGGLILPSYHLMIESLHQQTAQLPKPTSQKNLNDIWIGKTTEQAMQKGCEAMFENMMAQLHKKAKTDRRQLITTGGGWRGTNKNYEPDILFHGLCYFNQLNS
ncbi:MAG: type III pantothenate kinase [Alphaproteobacteria bacterium]